MLFKEIFKQLFDAENESLNCSEQKLIFENQNFKKLAECEVVDLSYDSRIVKKNEIYFCFSSNLEECEKWCQQASANGVIACVCAFPLAYENVLYLKDVQSVREVYALACANFFGRACDKLKIVGITGTNGKTTTSHVVTQMLQSTGKKAGTIGTNGVFYNGERFDCPLTTPDAYFLHKTFAKMLKAGVEYVVMEVSAHALAQKRCAGIMFEVGVLTNITQDHLDYFETFENYEKTKLSFFKPENMKCAVVCADDASSKKIIEQYENFEYEKENFQVEQENFQIEKEIFAADENIVKPTMDVKNGYENRNPTKTLHTEKKSLNFKILTYGVDSPAEVFAMDECYTIEGTHFVANVEDEILQIQTNLVGKYNVQNCLAALAVCKRLGLDGTQLIDGLRYILPVEGRFNVIKFDGKYVVIDFAHTPDGLEKVLQTAKNLTEKKLFVVFGCGGNRDKDKRHKMGLIAEKFCDYIFLTNDNPRFEKPLDIIADIESGMTLPHFVEPDRAKAIEKCIEHAEKGDIIVVAGKGAEKYQEIEGVKITYNDFDVLKKLKQKNWRK